jgi:hypothetical protein
MDTARSRAAQDAGKQPTPGPNTPPATISPLPGRATVPGTPILQARVS